ncbi:uncharacterized protein TRAVEDRAFT_36448 [Trametes versicolor FP-101664 SS1]|uniref:uncharacterized protein n=1 Tax=Trametes versicolor (strain FP-101664) TaxID=717944 RepID=UPI0004622FF5|nr:uncharacterized protein TRAVEDRAFT_36448 [Trametes versicolor FP-101664 SS1]EIW60885.1 hypothetical protein TRAVEDRAFT_36448 [Trametes versicolor FP-101664 SS1]
MSSVASTSAPGDLRRCFECNRSPPNGAKLQKCAGCSSSTALYCSKKCQKAAWPTHKILCCRADWSELDTDIVDREAQSLGYASTKLFSKSFCDFFTAHKWAINKATIAHILLKSGPSMEIARTNPRLEILVFRFRCEPPPQHRCSTPNNASPPSHNAARSTRSTSSGTTPDTSGACPSYTSSTASRPQRCSSSQCAGRPPKTSSRVPSCRRRWGTSSASA